MINEKLKMYKQNTVFKALGASIAPTGFHPSKINVTIQYGIWTTEAALSIHAHKIIVFGVISPVKLAIFFTILQL